MGRTRHSGRPEITFPPAVVPCIWMSAGLVAYKLCDREGECEGCPFDRAMRGALAAGPEPARPPAPEAPSPLTFPEDRRYHPGSHTWALEAGDGRVRLGVDAFFAALAGCPTAVVFPPPGSRLRPGEAACWLLYGSLTLPVRAPLGGSLERSNPRLQHEPEAVRDAPYSDGWLLELAPRGGELTGELAPAAAARSATQADMARFTNEAAAALDATGGSVGPTLADGGEPITDLHRLLGEVRYRTLVQRLLG